MTYYERKSVSSGSKRFTDTKLSTGDTRVIKFWDEGNPPTITKMQRGFVVVGPDEIHIVSHKANCPGIQESTEEIFITNEINRRHLHTNKGTRIIWKRS